MILDHCHTQYVNLSFRIDRDIRMKKELEMVGIKATRFNAFVPQMFTGAKYGVMRQRTPGAIACMESQLSIMKTALQNNQHACVFEDDLVFASDIQERLNYISAWMDKNEWDVFNLGATFHKEPTWHSKGHNNPEIKGKCNCVLNKDWEPTADERIVRTYGAWSTYAYIVNKYSLAKAIKRLEETIPVSIGIDFSMILLQPELKVFSFVPGSVKQIDNESNIGRGITHFSNFATLGSHWFQNLISDYDNTLMK